MDRIEAIEQRVTELEQRLAGVEQRQEDASASRTLRAFS
jgi:BMFP domain-containing protein YqiC